MTDMIADFATSLITNSPVSTGMIADFATGMIIDSPDSGATGMITAPISPEMSSALGATTTTTTTPTPSAPPQTQL
jgi:hypothetical protein